MAQLCPKKITACRQCAQGPDSVAWRYLASHRFFFSPSKTEVFHHVSTAQSQNDATIYAFLFSLKESFREALGLFWCIYFHWKGRLVPASTGPLQLVFQQCVNRLVGGVSFTLLLFNEQFFFKPHSAVSQPLCEQLVWSSSVALSHSWSSCILGIPSFFSLPWRNINILCARNSRYHFVQPHSEIESFNILSALPATCQFTASGKRCSALCIRDFEKKKA